jgi:arsenate reductase (thioredoxin)
MCAAQNLLEEEMVQAEKIYNVLFLCTGNSARSILAEVLLNQYGKGGFQAYSAGSHPAGKVNPGTLRFLQRNNLPADGLRSKSWDEFAEPGAPELDFVFTVCDKAAGEVCPVWPGQPMTAHWGVPDPAALEGGEAEIDRQFDLVAKQLATRIQLFISLPISKLDKLGLQNRLREIGKA